MEEKTGKAGAILRIVGVIAIIAVVIAAIVASMNHKTPVAEKVWYPEMTLGDMETAENHFIIYSDIACPYCIAFEAAMVEHHDELMEYIEKNDVLIEVRATDFLYEYGEGAPVESRYSAVATYCAKNEGKFWDFYDEAVATTWKDWFAGVGKSAFGEFNKMGKDYWVKMGRKVGLGDEFEKCVMNDETLDTVKVDARRMAKYVNGLPYFRFNSFVSSGFSLDWGWEQVLMYFDAGLKS